MTNLIKHLNELRKSGVNTVIVMIDGVQAEQLRKEGFNALGYTTDSVIINF